MSGHLEPNEPFARMHWSTRNEWAAAGSCVYTTKNSLGRRPAHLVVDLGHLRYCSTRGTGMLVQAGLIAAERDVGYALCGLSSHLDRIWSTVWGSGLPTRYGTVATAVAAIHATIPAATVHP